MGLPNINKYIGNDNNVYEVSALGFINASKNERLTLKAGEKSDHPSITNNKLIDHYCRLQGVHMAGVRNVIKPTKYDLIDNLFEKYFGTSDWVLDRIHMTRNGVEFQNMFGI